MWHWLVETLRSNPEIAIFLTLGLGFWAGKLKFGSFSLGVVTSTLLAGVLVGQLDITISANVKSTFFLMFLFAVGYSVGPQFFRSLKGDGIQQVLFAILQCVVVLLTAVGTGYVLGYDAGGTAGLLAGASTISAVLGVATGSINQLGGGCRRQTGHARCHAGRLRGDLPVRHRGIGVDTRHAGPQNPARGYRRGVPQV